LPPARSRAPAERIEGTQIPTNRPRSRSPENQSQTERANEIPAAAKKNAFDVAIALRLERSAGFWVDAEDELFMNYLPNQF
jgi:hypothetical protein